LCCNFRRRFFVSLAFTLHYLAQCTVDVEQKHPKNVPKMFQIVSDISLAPHNAA
jgi:hypothetical protein